MGRQLNHDNLELIYCGDQEASTVTTICMSILVPLKIESTSFLISFNFVVLKKTSMVIQSCFEKSLELMHSLQVMMLQGSCHLTASSSVHLAVIVYMEI